MALLETKKNLLNATLQRNIRQVFCYDKDWGCIKFTKFQYPICADEPVGGIRGMLSPRIVLVLVLLYVQNEPC